jgi:Domain of unknown function (DUF1844)
MASENEKSEVRVEDRRFFDKEGNPIREEEPQSSQEPASAGTTEPEQKEKIEAPPAKIDFASLVFLYVQTTLMYLGEVEDPAGQKLAQNLRAAQQTIDTLELLQEKTRGNLTPQEDQYLQGVLFDLRMRYVQKARKS